jgi:hypothetical protein
MLIKEWRCRDLANKWVGLHLKEEKWGAGSQTKDLGAVRHASTQWRFIKIQYRARITPVSHAARPAVDSSHVPWILNVWCAGLPPNQRPDVSLARRPFPEPTWWYAGGSGTE